MLKAGTPVVLMLMLHVAGLARITPRIAAATFGMSCGVVVASAGDNATVPVSRDYTKVQLWPSDTTGETSRNVYCHCHYCSGDRERALISI